MKNIKKIKIFCNNNRYSKEILKELIKKIKDNGYQIDDSNFDLGIAIGGDGTFLKMVKECEFNNQIYYLGINTGTLGFAQEIYPDEIDSFLQMLKSNNLKVENISVQKTNIKTKDDELYLESLNEVVIRDINLRTVHLDIFINNELLEKFVGDGILISTSFGSSAYNVSFGGSLVYSDLHVLQITPLAPLNSKTYRTLRNSVIIPEKRHILIKTKERNSDLIITLDGDNYFYNDVLSIETSVKKEKIKCLRMNNYDYTRRINEKFVK